jgi:hypothetical protein
MFRVKEESTVATQLNGLGYETILIGKDYPLWRRVLVAYDTTVSNTREFSAEDAEAIFEAAVNTLDEIAKMYEESAQNIEDGFGHPTYQSEEVVEKAEEIRLVAEAVRIISSESPPELDEDEGSLDE